MRRKLSFGDEGQGARDERGGSPSVHLPFTMFTPFSIFHFPFSLLFLVLSFQPLLAQVATVTGSAPNFIGKEIRLVVQDDPISTVERVLDRTTVDERGGFVLKGSVNPVQYGFLQVGRDCGDLFLERGKSVTVRFAPPKRPGAPEGFSDRYFFKLDFIEGDGARLNRDLSLYNSRLDALLERLYPLLLKRKNPKALTDSVETFRSKCESAFADAHPFLKQYIFYSLANLEQTFVLKKQLLYDRYLKDMQPQPDNPEYMRFVGQFFEGWFERMALVEKREECIAIMKKSAAFAEMEELFRSDPFLQIDFIRRAVLIQGMERLYGQKGYDPDRVSATLKTFSETTDNKVLGKAARNVAARKDRLRVNTPAPDFLVIDTEGKTHRLSDFKGDYLLLELTDAANGYCQQESAVLRDMQKRFNLVRFLTICVGNSEKEVASFKALFAPSRPVAAISREHQLVEELAIVSLPAFFIIDANGRLYRSPALDPSKGGISDLEVLQHSLAGKRKVGR
jgi:peroxiredoxin